MIENINDILEKPQCSAAHKFIKSGSLEKQQQWWKLYKKTFTGAPPPTEKQILKIKDFYQRELPKNPGRLTTDDLDNHEENLIRLMDDDYLTEAFKALSGFFTGPSCLWQKKEKLSSSKIVGVIKRKDNHKELTNLIKKNIQRAVVLLELYPFRHEIIESIPSQKDDQRGDWKKPFTIMLEDEAYKIIDEFSNPITDNGINSNLVDKIYNKKHKVDGKTRLLVGYEVRDKKKKHPKKLTKSTTRRRIEDYLEDTTH